MNTARYVVAIIVLASLPPGLLLWVAIHPWARRWRTLGPAWTYIILGVPTGLFMLGVVLARRTLVGTDYGTNYLLVAAAIAAIALGGILAIQRRRQLTFGTLAGLPELSPARYPGQLLTNGVYATIRHPRYVETLLWTLGYTLFANHLGPYLMLLACIPITYVVVLLEERELRQRFGPAYEEYCRQVPRFWPRRKRHAATRSP